MNLKKISIGLVALFGFGVIGLSAFTEEKSAALRYQYTGTSYADTTDPSKWVDISNNPVPSECDGESIPCTIEFQDTQYANMSAYLAVHNTPALVDDDDFVTSRKD